MYVYNIVEGVIIFNIVAGYLKSHRFVLAHER